MQLPRAPGGVRSASDNRNSRRAGSKGVLRQAMSELGDLGQEQAIAQAAPDCVCRDVYQHITGIAAELESSSDDR